MQAHDTIWVVSDGAAGNELQALALSSALAEMPPTVLRLRAQWPWSWLAPQFAPVLLVDDWIPTLTGPWPAIAIGAGRIGAAALLSIRRNSGGSTRTIQILDPRIRTSRFDVVIAPRHDQLSGANVLSIDGSLHAIDDQWIAKESAANPEFAELESPRRVVLIGGPRRDVVFGAAQIDALAASLAQDRQKRGGSVTLIGSRRTPLSWRTRLLAALGPIERSWFSANDGDNPYRAALASGDVFFVTADSVNMQSEALGTGCPVYSLGAVAVNSKIGQFQREMIDSGRVRMPTAQIDHWTYSPLRELHRITTQVRQMLVA